MSKGSHFFQQTLSLVNVCGISIIFQTKKKNNFGNETTFATSFQKSFQKNFFWCKKNINLACQPVIISHWRNGAIILSVKMCKRPKRYSCHNERKILMTVLQPNYFTTVNISTAPISRCNRLKILSNCDHNKLKIWRMQR